MKAGSVSGERGALAEDARESYTLPSRYYLDPTSTMLRFVEYS